MSEDVELERDGTIHVSSAVSMIPYFTTKSMVARAEAMMVVIAMVAMMATGGVIGHDDGYGVGSNCGGDGRQYT